MARHSKLLKKFQKLAKDVMSSVRGKQRRMDQRDEVLADSKGVLALMRGTKRRADKSFGKGVMVKEPVLAVQALASTFARYDFDLGGPVDNGVRMVLPAAVYSALGPRVGDKVEVLAGQYKGKTLEVTAVDGTAYSLRFADDAAKTSETSIAVEVRMSSLI
jgi:hypothetical protein